MLFPHQASAGMVCTDEDARQFWLTSLQQDFLVNEHGPDASPLNLIGNPFHPMLYAHPPGQSLPPCPAVMLAQGTECGLPFCGPNLCSCSSSSFQSFAKQPLLALSRCEGYDEASGHQLHQLPPKTEVSGPLSSLSAIVQLCIPQVLALHGNEPSCP